MKVLNFITLLFLFFLTPEARAEEKLPLVTSEWAPYSSSTMAGNGYVVEFITEVVREMGMEPEFMFYPSPRAQKIIQSGKVFGGFPYGLTEQRKQLFNHSDIFLHTNTKFFYDTNVLKKIDTNAEVESLKSYTVGVIRESKTSRVLKEKGFNRVYEVVSVEQAIRMLHSGRIQLAALVEHSGWHALRELFPEEKNHWAAIQFYEMEAALLVSRNYPTSDELLDKFNRALKIVEERGTMQHLLKKYALPE